MFVSTEVDEVLADPSWRWLNVDLPANLEHGYIASWKGDLKWVRGMPPAIPRRWPRWAVTLPDSARAERYTRYVSRVVAVAGILGLVLGSSLVVSGESRGWFYTILSVAMLWQAWALVGHGRESARFVALHLGPVLFFLILAVTGGVKSIQYLSDGNVSRAFDLTSWSVPQPPLRCGSPPTNYPRVAAAKRATATPIVIARGRDCTRCGAADVEL